MLGLLSVLRKKGKTVNVKIKNLFFNNFFFFFTFPPSIPEFVGLILNYKICMMQLCASLSDCLMMAIISLISMH